MLPDSSQTDGNTEPGRPVDQPGLLRAYRAGWPVYTRPYRDTDYLPDIRAEKSIQIHSWHHTGSGHCFRHRFQVRKTPKSTSIYDHSVVRVALLITY